MGYSDLGNENDPNNGKPNRRLMWGIVIFLLVLIVMVVIAVALREPDAMIWAPGPIDTPATPQLKV